jgi:hypothetical protein
MSVTDKPISGQYNNLASILGDEDDVEMKD